MIEPILKRVFDIAADATKALAVFEHDLGSDFIVQVRSERGRVVKAAVDITPTSVIIHFTNGIFEPLRVIVIG